MAGLKAQIEISADASGVDAGVAKAKRSLADLGQAGAAAGKQAGAGLAGIGAGGEEAAGEVDRATQRMIASVQRTTLALESGGRSSAKYFEAIASQRGLNTSALQPYIQQLADVEARQRSVTPAIESGRKALNAYGQTAGQTAAALRSVPAQLTDIVTSLQGGQKPLTVLLQQGGQLKDLFGGIAPAARALGGAVVGLVNPFTIAAAAVFSLGIAYKQGAEEGDAYAKALILTGNAAGSTAGRLQEQAKAVAESVGTQGKAAEAITALAATGRVAASDLEKLTLATVQFERTAGQSVADSAKQFAELGRAPVEAATKLNESTRFLTLSLYRQIKALEETGRAAEAASVAQRGYADAMLQRGAQLEARLGLIERGWIGIKDAAKLAWDSMLNVGRPNTLQEQLGRAQSDLEERQKRGPLAGGSVAGVNAAFERGNQTLRDRIGVLQESIRMEDRAGDAQRRAADQVEARIRFDKDGVQFLTSQAKAEREITKARLEGAAAGASAAEIEKRIADIREKYADKKGIASALRVDKAQLSLDLATLKSASEQLLNGFANDGRMLETLRSAQLVSEGDYFAKRRDLMITDAELRDYEAGREIAALQAVKRSGADKLDIDRKIAEAEAKRAIARANATSSLEQLSVVETAAAKRIAAAMLEARQATQAYFSDLERGQQRELAGFGQGNATRGRTSQRDAVGDRFEGQRRDAENLRARQELAGTFNKDAQAQYEQQLQIIADFQQRSLASFDTYYDALLEKQADYSNGINESFSNYIAAARDVAGQTEKAFDRALGGVEDAFVTLATTGKLSFKGLADSIIADIVRIMVRAQIAQLITTLVGGGGGYSFNGGVGTTNAAGISGGRATGGPVSRGRLYEINEKKGPGEILNAGGRQYLMPTANGSVAPAGGGMAGGVKIDVHNMPPEVAVDSAHQNADGSVSLVMKRIAQAEIAKAFKPGGFGRRAGAQRPPDRG